MGYKQDITHISLDFFLWFMHPSWVLPQESQSTLVKFICRRCLLSTIRQSEMWSGRVFSDQIWKKTLLGWQYLNQCLVSFPNDDTMKGLIKNFTRMSTSKRDLENMQRFELFAVLSRSRFQKKKLTMTNKDQIWPENSDKTNLIMLPVLHPSNIEESAKIFNVPPSS